MIEIEKPVLSQEGDTVKLSAKVLMNGISETLWYRFPAAYEKFLVTERSDAFVVGLLFLALRSGSDIKINGAISQKLHYTLTRYIITALTLANSEFKTIAIRPEKLDATDYNSGNCAGTGMSCGVDSLATYYSHCDEKKPFKIEYFTFLNAGSHGNYGGENSRKIYNRRFSLVQEYAGRVGKELIPVDSNLSELLKMDFRQTHSLRNISCILNLQKLFKHYYYASAYRLDYFKLNQKDTSDSDLLLVNMLSTEATTFFSSVASIDRIERTKIISEHEETYTCLNVCTNPDSISSTLNCTQCDKCLRTAMTLDLLGKLSLYSSVFDLGRYEINRDLFIGKIIARRKEDQVSNELYCHLKSSGKISRKHWFLSLKYSLHAYKKGLKTNIIRKPSE